MEKRDYEYKLGHDQFKRLVYEIQAIHSFNYQQFKKLSQISNHVLEGSTCKDEDFLVDAVREIMSFNFKQHKKLKRIVWDMNKIIDPNWEPPRRINNDKHRNNIEVPNVKKEGADENK